MSYNVCGMQVVMTKFDYNCNAYMYLKLHKINIFSP